ncbi:MAG: hypothetical protein QM605_08390 [Sphingobium sp.]
MIYKVFAAATLVLAFLVGLMADRLTPVRAPGSPGSEVAPVTAPPVGQQFAPSISRSEEAIAPSQEAVAPPPPMPGETSAFGQPMPGAGAPSLSPGNGLPQAPASSIESMGEGAEPGNAG